MKTIKRNLLVVVFMLGTLVNYANEKKDFNFIKNSKKVRVEFNNVKIGHSLIIKDNSGYILYEEDINKKGQLTKFFDFSSLKDGHYIIELNKDFEILTKPFFIKSKKVIFDKTSEELIFKPVIRTKENLVYLSKISFDEKPLKVTISYKDSEIYSETIDAKNLINRVYKLNKSEKGNYRLDIKTNGRLYSKNFKI